MSSRFPALLFALVAMFRAAPAAADLPVVSPSWTALRFTGLFLHAEAQDFGATVMLPLAGVQLQYIDGDRWVAEGAAHVLLGLQGPGFDAIARGGYAIGLHGRTDTLQTPARGFIVPLLGYRYAQRPVTRPADGYAPFNETHSAQLGFAYDLFVGRGNAFALRTFAAGEYALVSKKRPDEFTWSYTTQEPMKTSLQAGIGLGIAFGRD